jgi:murein DD-endopeptidase MepM/ murein hydrolase activator NlpD
MGFLEFLLAPKDMAAIMDSQYYFERIMKQDVELIQDLKIQHEALNRKKADLLKKRQQIQELAQSIKIQEQKLSSQKVSKATQMSRLNTQIFRMEKENRELAEASSELTSFIVTNGKAKDGWFGIGEFVKPTNGWMSSKFGYRHHPIFKRRILHRGIDLAAPRGRPIKAAQSGVVLVAGRKKKYKGYGIVTVINHGRSEKNKRLISTVYAHQSRVMVKAGDFVNKGSVIGWVGSTGYSTGPHLHFEVRENGVPVNPLGYLKL